MRRAPSPLRSCSTDARSPSEDGRQARLRCRGPGARRGRRRRGGPLLAPRPARPARPAGAGGRGPRERRLADPRRGIDPPTAAAAQRRRRHPGRGGARHGPPAARRRARIVPDPHRQAAPLLAGRPGEAASGAAPRAVRDGRGRSGNGAVSLETLGRSGRLPARHALQPARFPRGRRVRRTPPGSSAAARRRDRRAFTPGSVRHRCPDVRPRSLAWRRRSAIAPPRVWRRRSSTELLRNKCA